MSLSEDLLSILRCPRCHGRLEERADGAQQGLVCAACRVLYPVVDEVPSFLAEDARPL
jgi:uncharacterized protein YbaR (Trm112 family)